MRRNTSSIDFLSGVSDMRTLRPSITDEMATLVGQVTASWNLVEMQLQTIMQALLRTDASRCQIVFLSHQTCRAKIELTKSLSCEKRKGKRSTS